MTRSDDLFHEAQKVLVGGVNSPVRSFRGVGSSPLVFRSGSGAHLEDVDGKKYIDFVGSWGPLILGHAPEVVRVRLEAALKRGWTFGACVESEAQLARAVLLRHPGLDKIRFVNSGTEATMSALRLARGKTGREDVVKFAGGYHGHVDALLVEAGSGLATLGTPSSLGIPASVAGSTHVLPYNDATALENFLRKAGERVAAVIVEPVAGNMGLVPPTEEFLGALRRAHELSGALLIMDEVMTGFRVGYQSARGRFNLPGDIVTFGKVIGGGLPVGAYAARAELMDLVAPLGGVYQAGTLSGNPLAMEAGLATVENLTRATYEVFEKLGREFAKDLAAIFREHSVPAQVHQVGSMLGFFLTEKPVKNFAEACTTDTALYSRMFKAALEEGVYLPPSAYETFFLSTAHDATVLNEALSKLERALKRSLQ
ncbi:MAG: glutamate-1-semialdehyde 2,1-aminomutase [Planctomycetota bacterium]